MSSDFIDEHRDEWPVAAMWTLLRIESEPVPGVSVEGQVDHQRKRTEVELEPTA